MTSFGGFGGGNGFGGAPGGFQTPAFGAGGAAQTPAFGGFGAPAATPAFGAAGGFATPAPQFGAAAAPFGGGGTAFGAPQQATAMGGGFGQAQAGFAAPAANAYGQPSGLGGFGAPAQQGGFGATGYGAPQGGFGAAAAPAVSFGAAPAATTFGGSTFAGAGAGGFGANSGFGGGASSFTAGGGGAYQGNQAGGYNQGKVHGGHGGFTGGKDGNGDNCVVNSICAKLRDQSGFGSLESQRFVDYSQGRKGSAPAQGSTFGVQGFPGAAGGAATPFGQQPQIGFGQTAPVSAFGQQPAAMVGFGAPQQQQQQQQQQPLPFGQTSAFGATGAAAFGAPATGIFGAQKPGGTGFAGATTPFGAPPAFGTGAAAPTTAFGGFGAAPAATGAGLFGGATAFGAPTGTATNMFGQPQATGGGFPPAFGVLPTAAAPALSGFPLGAAGIAPVAPAPAPSTAVVSVSAPAAEPKYADASSSRIEFEDRESGRVVNSSVYARHHNHVAARDPPPTLLWQSTRDKQHTNKTAAASTPRNQSSVPTTPMSYGRPAAAASTLPASSSGDRLKALKLLYDHILPCWNQTAFSGVSKDEIERNRDLDKPDQTGDFHTQFKLAEKHGIQVKPMDNYLAKHFKDTAGYMLLAESQAVRFDANRTRKDVPVKVKMTVAGDSFTALLDMIVQQFKADGLDEGAVQRHYDNPDIDQFYPFDICLEWATPYSASSSPDMLKLVHFPMLGAHKDDPARPFLPEHETQFLARLKRPDPVRPEHCVFLGFPRLENCISGMRHLFGGSRDKLFEDLSRRAPPPVLPTALSELLDRQHSFHPRDNTRKIAALTEQAVPSAPRLYLSLGFNSRTGSESTLPRGTVMDMHFEAVFFVCGGCKGTKAPSYEDKCICCFDPRLKNPKEFTEFVEEFHNYFEKAVTQCSLWGDYYSAKGTTESRVRDITPLKPQVDMACADRFTPPLKQQALGCVWRFALSHSFGRS
jgi:hypothetical protein